MLKITAYADRLIDDLDDVDYIDRVKTQQSNWIGRSPPVPRVNFDTTAGDTLTVYTTRADTLFGCTYMVISARACHSSKSGPTPASSRMPTLSRAYQEEAARKSDFERTELNKEKTGVVIDGVQAINPVNGTQVPIFVSDYVLATYGTGAIMAVPAHDTRDWEFAKKFDLPIIEVVKGAARCLEKEAFTDCATGITGQFRFAGRPVGGRCQGQDVRTGWKQNGQGPQAKSTSSCATGSSARQRYWGEPIPMVYCEQVRLACRCPRIELPLKLPEVRGL